MKYQFVWGMLAMILTVPACSSGTSKLDGSYVSEQDASITLTVTEKSNVVSGVLADSANRMSLTASREGNRLAGTVGSTGNALPFTATFQNERLVLDIGGEQLSFRRDDASRPATNANIPSSATSQRQVVINGRQLIDTELAQIEQAYRIRIENARYWYDPVLGAWGLEGGPTLGFIQPGVNLGGALRANASGSGTGVFVNGRELHPNDVSALQQVTGPIVPGRYFIYANGLAGYEGGAPLWNLAQMAAQSRGGSNNWQSSITGASGFSDGNTGAVFLPNGGIVSYGQ